MTQIEGDPEADPGGQTVRYRFDPSPMGVSVWVMAEQSGEHRAKALPVRWSAQ